MSTPTQEHNATYTVTARKWRPTLFHGVVGQEHVTQTLRNAVQSGRVHHAYIFNGPRGVGKTTTARILAKALNCLNPGADSEPCNECASCTDIATGRSIDIIEIDGASNNSVDDVRKLRENAKYPPAGGKYKMYIIDEVHMLSTSAFNALLKTLEEPPRHLIFVFATTEPHRVPATILSRCQRFDFRRMQIDDIVGHLRYIAEQEHIAIDEESLVVIAKKGDGSMRDSQSIFDQVVSFCGTTVSYAHVNEALNLIDQEFFFTISRAIRQHDVPTILDLTRQIFTRGYDLQECLNGLAEHFRNILTVLATGDARLIETSKTFHDAYIKESVHYTQADVLQLMNILITTEQALRFAPQPRLRFEFALIQMAKMDTAVDISTLLRELEEVKKKIDSGTLRTTSVAAPVTPTPVPSSTAQQTPAAVPTPTATAVAEPTPTYTAAPAQAPTAAPAPTPAPQAPSAPPQAPVAKQLVPTRPEPSAPVPTKQTPQTITAAELQQRWQGFMRTSEKLDTAFKRLAKAQMFSIAFGESEVTLTPSMPDSSAVVANTLMEKKVLLTEALLAYFSCSISVHVSGGITGKKSAFDDIASDQQPAQNTDNGSIVSENHVPYQAPAVPAASEEGSHSALPSTGDNGQDNTQPDTQHAPTDDGTLHPLDKAILDNFQAVEIPIR